MATLSGNISVLNSFTIQGASCNVNSLNVASSVTATGITTGLPARASNVAAGNFITQLVYNYAGDGKVFVTGSDTNGALGMGGVGDKSTIIQVTSLTTVMDARSSRGPFCIYLSSDGTVHGVGVNTRGQLGQNDIINRSTPVPIIGVSTAVSIGIGAYHSMMVLQDGTVRTIGLNANGQLGDGTTVTRSTIVQVSGVSTAVACAGGQFHSAFVLSNGQVRSCGFNGSGQIGNNTRGTIALISTMTGVTSASQVACCNNNTYIRMADGTVYAVGANAEGQIGDNTNLTRSTITQVLGLTSITNISGAANGNHALFLCSDGKVFGVGDNGNGQLGDGTTIDRSTIVQFLNVTNAVKIAAGNSHSVVVLSDGLVVACGSTNSGCLGNGQITGNKTTIVEVIGASSAVQLGPKIDNLHLGADLTYQLDLTTDGARKYSGQFWTTGSDERIKTEICTANLERCAEIVDAIDLKYFKWNDDIDAKDRRTLGWIAQDVQNFFPNAVKLDPNTNLYSLNSDQLIKVLYGAIKHTYEEFFSNQ